MANLYSRAADELRKKNDQLRKFRDEKRKEGEIAAASASVLGGAALAGFIDAKWGEGEAADVFGVPIAAALGGLTAVSAAAFDIPYRKEIGAAGIGAASGALYRYIVDNVEFGDDEEEPEP